LSDVNRGVSVRAKYVPLSGNTGTRRRGIRCIVAVQFKYGADETTLHILAIPFIIRPG